ncbi:MAG: TatD family hydrolase [Rikenellaceae bacterium]
MKYKLIDTHAHLSDAKYENDIADVILRSREGGVKRVLMPDVGIEGREEMLALCDRYPDYLIPMVGLHPTTVNEIADWRVEVDEVERLLQESPRGRFCAIGEIGLDYYWSSDFIKEQQESFVALAELSLRYDLPLNIHTRDAWGDMCDLLESMRGRGLRGVMHAFCDTEQSYRRISQCGDFLFAIGGVVTFKRSQVAAVVGHIDLEHLLLETDAPYLTPTPHRGTRNEPLYLEHICDKIAELKGVSAEVIAHHTTLNAERIFGL